MKAKLILILIMYFIILFALSFFGLYLAESDFSQLTKTIGLIATFAAYIIVVIFATIRVLKSKI